VIQKMILLMRVEKLLEKVLHQFLCK